MGCEPVRHRAADLRIAHRDFRSRAQASKHPSDANDQADTVLEVLVDEADAVPDAEVSTPRDLGWKTCLVEFGARWGRGSTPKPPLKAIRRQALGPVAFDSTLSDRFIVSSLVFVATAA